MEPFKTLRAVACPLAFANVDTDQLVPARFMSTPRSAGYGSFLFHDVRRGQSGEPGGRFPLDDPQRCGARIIVARRNFGCGSSREAAVYALVDAGIRCVIAPSFGEIFAGNALSNGLLTARTSEADADRLIAALDSGVIELTVDLESQTISCGGASTAFEIDPPARLRLINGWDDLDLTLSHTREIDDFVQRDRGLRPWAAPVIAGPGNPPETTDVNA